jgi:hypothetical protein
MLVALGCTNPSFISLLRDPSSTDPVEVTARRMLLPMTRCNLVHRNLGVCSQSPASICLLAPKLLACGWLVWRELARHRRSCILGNQVVLEGDVRSGRSDKVGWSAGLLRKSGVCGGCGGGCLKKGGPIAICASRVGGLGIGVLV